MRVNGGFTLIELLVVIVIVALLIGILLPALGSARATGRAVSSLSNLRQWGIGTAVFITEHRDLLPWDGEDSPFEWAGDPPRDTWRFQEWYANAVPPNVGQPGYAKGNRDVARLGVSSIYVDPSAAAPDADDMWDYPGGYFDDLPDGVESSRFFSYVFNSAIASGRRNRPDLPGIGFPRPQGRFIGGVERFNIDDLLMASATVMMIEQRSTDAELERGPFGRMGDPYRGRDLNRVKGDWQRMTVRHLGGGGHLLFADGHGEFVAYRDAITDGQGVLPAFRVRDPFVMNRSDRIWGPMEWRHAQGN